jgi:hypothetical protein
MYAEIWNQGNQEAKSKRFLRIILQTGQGQTCFTLISGVYASNCMHNKQWSQCNKQKNIIGFLAAQVCKFINTSSALYWFYCSSLKNVLMQCTSDVLAIVCKHSPFLMCITVQIFLCKYKNINATPIILCSYINNRFFFILSLLVSAEVCMGCNFRIMPGLG